MRAADTPVHAESMLPQAPRPTPSERLTQVQKEAEGREETLQARPGATPRGKWRTTRCMLQSSGWTMSMLLSSRIGKYSNNLSSPRQSCSRLSWRCSTSLIYQHALVPKEPELVVNSVENSRIALLALSPHPHQAHPLPPWPAFHLVCAALDTNTYKLVEDKALQARTSMVALVTLFAMPGETTAEDMPPKLGVPCCTLTCCHER
jgi:hypothetical protein